MGYAIGWWEKPWEGDIWAGTKYEQLSDAEESLF